MSQDVDLPLLLEPVDGALPRQRHDARVQDEDVEGATGRKEGLRGGADGRQGRQVQHQRFGRSVGCSIEQFSDGALGLGLGARTKHHVKPGVQETAAGLSSNAGVAAGDQRDGGLFRHPDLGGGCYLIAVSGRRGAGKEWAGRPLDGSSPGCV